MDVIRIIIIVIIGLIAGGFIGASAAHITSYKKEFEKDSFEQVLKKMIQPILFFLLIYGISFLIRGWTGLVIGAVAGIVPFVMNYQGAKRQRHLLYARSANASKDAVKVLDDLNNSGNDDSFSERHFDTVVKGARLSAKGLEDRFKCTNGQSARVMVQLAGISLVVIGRRAKQNGMDEGTRERLLKGLISAIAAQATMSPAQAKEQLTTMINENQRFMSSPLVREGVDDLTRHGFMVMIAKTIAGDNETSARSMSGIAVDKMVDLGWTVDLAKLDSRS